MFMKEEIRDKGEIASEVIKKFKEHLCREEKSAYTIEKYIRDAKAFICFAGRRLPVPLRV